MRPASSPASVGGSAAHISHADASSVPFRDYSRRQPASAPHSRQVCNSAAPHVGNSTAQMSTGSTCVLQQELTLATPPCDGVQEQAHAAGAPDTWAPQNAVDNPSCCRTGGEESVHNPGFVASGAGGTNWGATTACVEVHDIHQQWLGSLHVGPSRHEDADLNKGLFAPLQVPCVDENVQPERPMSTELVAWSPHCHTQHTTAGNVRSAALVPASERGSVSPSHTRDRQLSPLPDDRITELQLHRGNAPGPLPGAVQCGCGPARCELRTSVVHFNDVEDAVHSAMPRRQLQVVQQFVAESVVPTLAQCALTPAEHALVCSA